MVHSPSSSLGDYYMSERSSLYSEPETPPPTTSQSAVPRPLQQHTVRKQTSLTPISVPSFSAFRSQASSIPTTAQRKAVPFPISHSPRAASFSLTERASPRLAEPPSRPFSLDSPLPQQPSALATALSPPLTEESSEKQADRSSYAVSHSAHGRNESIDSRVGSSDTIAPAHDARQTRAPENTGYAHKSHTQQHSISSIESGEDCSQDKSFEDSSMHVSQAPSMTLQFNGIQRTLSDESLNSDSPRSRDQRPKSPGGRLGNFFGWKSSPQRAGTESPTTTFSDRSLSPLPSPRLEKSLAPSTMAGSASMARLTPPGLDVHKANSSNAQYFDNPETPILLGSPETNAHVRELENELAQVSTELAGSIKREMDLEDEVERLRAEVHSYSQSDLGRRSSDYFSDSGASATRYPVSDPDARLDQMEQKVRKVGQEKAQIKNEMASRLQTELGRRRDLEEMIQNLENQLQKRFDDVEDDRSGYVERVSELEASLEESRRRLVQEREAKDSFGDLYSATRLELEQHKNERDNLRDEVLPQLKARLEGMEAEAADAQALMYENTRMQQELAALREKSPMFSSIAEEDDNASPNLGSRSGLSRSGSLARASSKRGASLTRSGSVKERSEGGRQRSGSNAGLGVHVSMESVKEIEDQRDALHKALKLLISRHEKQQREHARAIKKISSARESAESTSPKRTAYHKEVSSLKEEVTTLRKRTEDALEQKWQYEKGLSGLKMDLDRAESETRSLRNLLQDHDIIVRSLSNAGQEDEQAADEGIKLSISEAEDERDQARQLAEDYHQRALAASDDTSQGLLDSAKRMDELASQLDGQVRANVQLQERLREAVSKGDREQKESTRQIEEMQKRLAGMEDSVLAAQQHSENTLGTHEAEVRRIEEATSPALQRLHITIPDTKRLSPHASPMMAKSPRFFAGTKLAETSLLETSRTQMLERKVRELEGLLKEAEDDVQTVVQRVNRSQLEVANLQTERDAALTQMRKLQGLVVQERERAEALMPDGNAF